ncbi:hypothetical protein HMPREF1705_04665 [Acetomicrobium hydrogeniformans ATCC BAA-1850]|uniref:Uncharacterized protein n=1 Tax=Acetomicrobium hydrogeniformans ATCC BAA-1850 TaxID=592015 RepID=A0A0T5XBC1_9BACT|nr:hypothetical protein HMPREF1705_04665 [Acetomicrobium hydrogeniformans ATCC BAA-1850]
MKFFFKDLSPYGHGGIYGLDRSTCIKAQSHGEDIYRLEEMRHG